MKKSNWNVRSNAPKQDRGQDISLESEMDAVSKSGEDMLADAVPDSDPNRPEG